MTPTVFICLMIVAVALLTFMTLKLKMHPVMTLFIISAFLGIALGDSLLETMQKINEYFGSTLSGIGITIIFGAIIAMGIQDTGAATRITNFFIKLFKGKRLELAPSLSAFVMSLSVFGDITMVLTSPIAAILALRKKINMVIMAPYINLGLTLTHGLIPPTPGILAVAILMGADIGQVILWGFVISLVSFVLTYILTRPILAKGEFIPPNPEFTEGYKPAPKGASLNELYIKEDNIPSTFLSFMPLIIPLILISIGSFANMIFEEDSTAYTILASIGDKTFALFIGVILVALLIMKRKQKVLTNAKKHEFEVANNASGLEISMNNWVVRALKIAIIPLIITGMGGAMGGILRESPVIDEIGDSIISMNFPTLLIPFALAAILMAVTGSMTIAAMTAAALVYPMLGALGLSPVVATLAVGSGSMVFWHVNNSGFWMMTSLFNFNTKQGLKYFTTINGLGGIMAFAVLCIIAVLGWA